MIGTDDGSQEKESHWLPLIGLKGDMKFTPQNHSAGHSAVKGQTPWLRVKWEMWSAECGKYGVWKIRSVENAECGK